MSSDQRFSDEEWKALAAGPAAAASAIIGSGQAGFFGTIKEMKAAIKSIKHAAPTDPAAADFVHDLMQFAKEHENEDDATSTDDVDHDAIRADALNALESAGMAAHRLTPEERSGYADWLVGIAREVAQAAPDKGQKQAVSAAEEDAIAEIERLLRG